MTNIAVSQCVVDFYVNACGHNVHGHTSRVYIIKFTAVKYCHRRVIIVINNLTRAYEHSCNGTLLRQLIFLNCHFAAPEYTINWTIPRVRHQVVWFWHLQGDSVRCGGQRDPRHTWLRRWVSSARQLIPISTSLIYCSSVFSTWNLELWAHQPCHWHLVSLKKKCKIVCIVCFCLCAHGTVPKAYV